MRVSRIICMCSGAGLARGGNVAASVTIDVADGTIIGDADA